MDCIFFVVFEQIRGTLCPFRANNGDIIFFSCGQRRRPHVINFFRADNVSVPPMRAKAQALRRRPTNQIQSTSSAKTSSRHHHFYADNVDVRPIRTKAQALVCDVPLTSTEGGDLSAQDFPKFYPGVERLSL